MPDTVPGEAPIAFVDLEAQQRRIGDRLGRAVRRVMEHGKFILGPEVAELESRLAAFCGARRCVTCANGTDALTLALMAKGVGPGQAVLVPAFTFAATAEVVAHLGAVPVFLDVLEDSFNLDPAGIAAGVAVARERGLRPVGIIPVDLFGQPADYGALLPLAADHELWVVADAAQSFGGEDRGRRVGTLGELAATSFFPAKPLGCYGDGGALFVDDDGLAEVLRSLRVHGQGSDKYDNVRIGLNSRLDTLQAAILLEKLSVFAEEIEARNRIAARYTRLLEDVAAVPRVRDGAVSVWAQYTLRLPGGRRDAVAVRLKAAGVPTAVYYPRPLNRQTAFRGFPVAGDLLPVAERLSDEVLSLPMHPYLDEPTQDRIVAAVRAAIAGT